MQNMSGLAELVFLRNYADRRMAGRNEGYGESIGRVMRTYLKKSRALLSRSAYEALETEFRAILPLILGRKVMPSMRALSMSGDGRVLEYNDTTVYNCCYAPMEHHFDNFNMLMYILMCGAGDGYSVERRYINQWPEVPAELIVSEREEAVVRVPDSREGWSASLGRLVELMYEGVRPRYDLSQIRPKGSLLRGTGGTASGPEGLEWLFQEFIVVFEGAVGRRLCPHEVHGLNCRIGEIVRMGNQRRSAMICLGDLDDWDMRHFKDPAVVGDWYTKEPWRGRANNSAVYEDGFTWEEFGSEFKQLLDSGNGERGCFFRGQVHKYQSPARRRGGDLFSKATLGTNPCGEIILLPYQSCNLTDVDASKAQTVDDLAKQVRAAAFLGTIQAQFTNFEYLASVNSKWREHTEAERLLGVSLSGIYASILVKMTPVERGAALDRLREEAVSSNQHWAKEFGIAASTAVTTIKPSGTASLVMECPPGIHPEHGRFYSRQIIANGDAALLRWMKAVDWPHKVSKQDGTIWLQFPVKAQPGAVCKGDISAVEHMEMVKQFQQHWAEHSVSVTIDYTSEERDALLPWMKENYQSLSAMSFLPIDTQEYEIKPLETLSEGEYEELAARCTPDALSKLRLEDTGDEIVAGECTGGGCVLT